MSEKILKNYIDILNRCILTLKEAADVPDIKKDISVVDATVQRFEYTFEASWKLMQGLAKEYKPGEDIKGPRASIKYAYSMGLIKDCEKWFEFLKIRNLTTHTYNEDSAVELFENVEEFIELVEYFLLKVNKKMV